MIDITGGADLAGKHTVDRIHPAPGGLGLRMRVSRMQGQARGNLMRGRRLEGVVPALAIIRDAIFGDISKLRRGTGKGGLRDNRGRIIGTSLKPVNADERVSDLACGDVV